METDQQHAGNDAAKHGNALQEINTNQAQIINGISHLPKALEAHNDNENLEPMGPKGDGIKYSENIVPAEEDEDDQENLKPAAANIDMELQETKKKRKKKSKSKRGLVTLRMALDRCNANFNHGAEGKADRLRGVLC